MLRWTSTRCGGFLVHWKADDHAGVWFAGLSRMRRDRYAQGGMVGLSMLVQQTLKDDPFDGAVFAFRGRRAGLIKLIWHDGIGLCMLTKRLEHGQFVWPSADTTGRLQPTLRQH